jgi:hypothetical protein
VQGLSAIGRNEVVRERNTAFAHGGEFAAALSD